MPIARVQVQDGRIMRLEVPEGTTPDQVESFVAQQLVAQDQPAQPQEDGVWDKFQRDAAEAANNPSLVSSMAKGASATANLGMGMAGKLVPDAVKNLVGEAGQVLLEKAQNIPGMQSYQKAWEEQPQAVKDVEQAVFDVTGLLGTGAGLKAAAPVAGKAAMKAVDMAGRGAMNVGDKILNFASDSSLAGKIQSMAEKSNAGYRAARESGEVFDPEMVANKFVDKIEAIRPRPIAGQVMTQEAKDFAKHLDDFVALRGSKMNLDDVDALDKALTDKINTSFVDKTTGKVTGAGRQLQQAQIALRDMLDDVPDSAANANLKNGINFFAAKKRLEDLDAIAERASMSQNPHNALREGYKNLYLDKDRIRGWPKEAQLLLKKAGTPSITSQMLAPITGRLTSIIAGGTGNVLGAAGANLAGIGARGVQEMQTARRGLKVQESIIKNALEKERTIPTPKPEPQKLLPSPNSARPMTADQIKAAQEQINRQPRAPSGDIERNPNMEGIKNTTVRNPDGTLERAPLMSMPYRNTNAYKNLPYIKQRFVDKVVQDYTSAGKSKAEVIRDMARRGQISPQDASEILDSLKDIKIWRNDRNRVK